MAAELAQLEGAIEYRFRRRELLAQAVTHSSCSQAAAPSANNERLEFLGDSILGFIVSERLSAQFPARPEGELTKLRASLVSAANLVKVVDGLERQFGELRERMAHLEGLREAISGRAAASMQGEPKQPKELRRPSVSSRPRKNKGWFYWKDPVTGQGHFLACANQQGSCSMRIFDETSGAFIRQPDNKIGDYQERFAEDLKSAVELHISSQPNLVQASKNGLPPEVLSELQGQMS